MDEALLKASDKMLVQHESWCLYFRNLPLQKSFQGIGGQEVV